MKKWIVAFISTLILSVSSSVWADSNADFTSAKNVIENWFAAMKDKQMDKAADFLAPEFVSIHTDGIVRDKTQELTLIKNLHMKSFQLTDFKFSQSGDIITVTYKDKGVEQIDKKSIDHKPAGRMAVLQKQNGQWVIVAYANLDKIG